MDLTECPALAGWRKAINRAVRSSGEMGATRFQPRHGVRLERGGECLDLLICHERPQIHAFDAAGFREFLSPVGSAEVLDRILGDRGVVLAND